jgi:hypothetical protein
MLSASVALDIPTPFIDELELVHNRQMSRCDVLPPSSNTVLLAFGQTFKNLTNFVENISNIYDVNKE